MSSRSYRYRALAETLAQALRAGLYPPGSRLPSVRQLCEQHRASLATVTHALQRLEEEGLVEARPRLGFFASAALPAPLLPPPATEALALQGRRKRLLELAATQPDCLSLGHLALPASLLPVAALRRELQRQLREDSTLLAGGAVFGHTPLREQLALRARRHGVQVDAEAIVLTQGEGESLQLCLRLLTEPGALVALASPAPFHTLELLASLGLRVLEIPAGVGGGLSVAALEGLLEQHQVAVCLAEPSFCRASGASLSDADKQRLCALLARHRLPLIECDLMGELYHGPERPRPLKAFDAEDWVLYCGSFGCITGPGFNLGYVASARYRLQLRAERTVHGELLPQLTEAVLARFIADGGMDAHLRRLRPRLARQMVLWRAAVLAAFPPGTWVHRGDGGQVLWVELPAGLDACALLAQARRQGYTFVPGAVFSLGPRFDHCLRLTSGHPLDAARAEGLRVLGALATAMLADQACAPTVSLA